MACGAADRPFDDHEERDFGAVQRVACHAGLEDAREAAMRLSINQKHRGVLTAGPARGSPLLGDCLGDDPVPAQIKTEVRRLFAVDMRTTDVNVEQIDRLAEHLCCLEATVQETTT